MHRLITCTIMGFSAVACRQPDRQSTLEPSVQAPVVNSPSGPRHGPGTSTESPRTACVIPMAEPALPQATGAATCPIAPESTITLARGQVTFDDAPSKPTLLVELARTDETRQRGLMYRTNLPAEEGMLFSWDDEAPRAFWMHNTCIPLDMLFIGKDGGISGILEQVPVLNDASRGIACPVAHVLEVNAGWVRGHNVKPGQHLTISLP